MESQIADSEASNSKSAEVAPKQGTELLTAKCSLCYDFMHYRCIQAPLWLILSGGIYMKHGIDFEWSKKVAAEIEPLLTGSQTLSAAVEN